MKKVIKNKVGMVVPGFIFFLVAPAPAQLSTPSLDATLESSRSSPYENEIFYLTLTIRAKGVRLGQDVELVNLPETNRLELGVFRELQPQRSLEQDEIVEVRRYQCTARALMPGKMRLSPKVRLSVLSRRPVSFFMATWVETRQELPVTPLEFEIRSLPLANRPRDFLGAIGQFDFDVQVAPTNVAVNDLVSVLMTVTGDGYWPKGAYPRISEARYFRVYNPDAVSSGKGVRTFKQILIPLSTNATFIPSVTWSYFEPASDSYVTLARGPFPLVLEPQREMQVQRMYVPSSEIGIRGAEPMPVFKSRVRLPSSATNLLDEAQRAFDNKDFPTVIQVYKRLLECHSRSAALYCNLGTVHFFEQDYGRAILNYYRALRLAPRDAETRRNLTLALQRTGAWGWETRPGAFSVFSALSNLLSVREWAVVLVAVVIVTALVVVRLGKQRRCSRRGLLLLIPVFLAVALSITVVVTDMRFAGREVIVIERCTAHIAPATSSLVNFVCPSGTRGVVLGRIPGWMRIAVGPAIGWIPESSLILVSGRAE